MSSIQHSSSARVGGIAESRLAYWIRNPRVEAAYVVFELGFSLERLAGRLHRDLAGTRDDEFDAGYRVGFRAGRRDTSKRVADLARLAFDAGRAKGEDRPIGEAYELGFDRGVRRGQEAAS